MDNRRFIAKKIASFFKDGDVINLGVGIPVLVGDYITDNVACWVPGPPIPAWTRRPPTSTPAATPWTWSPGPAYSISAPPSA